MKQNCIPFPRTRISHAEMVGPAVSYAMRSWYQLSGASLSGKNLPARHRPLANWFRPCLSFSSVEPMFFGAALGAVVIHYSSSAAVLARDRKRMVILQHLREQIVCCGVANLAKNLRALSTSAPARDVRGDTKCFPPGHLSIGP
jgi:hypothetical protein